MVLELSRVCLFKHPNLIENYWGLPRVDAVHWLARRGGSRFLCFQAPNIFSSPEYSEYPTRFNTLLHLHCICSFSDSTFLFASHLFHISFHFIPIQINTANNNLSVQDVSTRKYICGSQYLKMNPSHPTHTSFSWFSDKKWLDQQWTVLFLQLSCSLSHSHYYLTAWCLQPRFSDICITPPLLFWLSSKFSAASNTEFQLQLVVV